MNYNPEAYEILTKLFGSVSRARILELLLFHIGRPFYQREILFVALGSPKQEEWIERYLPEINVKVCQGIGGTLDTIADAVKRAPVAFRKMGLEWFYRLIKEPGRIRRQKVLPVFALSVLGEKIRGVK